jgi:hypothetical protein
MTAAFSLEKSMQRMFNSFTMLLGLLALTAAGTSASLPFERHGIIERLSAHQEFIVINDVMYILPTTARVHFFMPKAKRAKDQEPPPADGNAFLLRPGMHIGYRVEGEGSGRQGRVVEAWILPPGAVTKSHE